jgi:hypothetical protein
MGGGSTTIQRGRAKATQIKRKGEGDKRAEVIETLERYGEGGGRGV